MRTLKYAILGLLNRESLSGYDLSNRFESELNEFWSAKHSQIYPELKKLTAEGLIDFTIEISGSVLERKVYSITQAGQESFFSWLSTMDTMERTPKDVFRLRMFFSHELDIHSRMTMIQHELKQHRQRLEYLQSNYRKYITIPSKESSQFGDYLVLMGAVMREEAACKWLEKCIALTGK